MDSRASVQSTQAGRIETIIREPVECDFKVPYFRIDQIRSSGIDQWDMEDHASLLRVAIEAAETAAVPLKEVVSGYRKVHMEDSHDVKLQADLESERRIRAFLRERTDYPIIGEEEGGDPGLLERKDPYWVVDPLDGTFNYQRSIPHCCVSIALMRGRDALVGAVLDFNRNELFTGGEGLPFCINGQPHTPKWADSIGKACLCTGFPHEMDRSDASVKAFFHKLFQYKKVRMIGTAALSVSYVGAGYYDAYYETGVRLWDIAAGIAFARSTGAHIELKDWPGNTLTFDFWMAGKPGFVYPPA